MVWAGLLLGLLANQALRLAQAPRAAALEATLEARDLYAEARRSRAILERQEAAPAPADRGGGHAGGDAGGAGAGAGAGDEALPESGYLDVIDGDSFAYGAVRVRIADIDAPEVHGGCPSESALAARATARLRALLGAGPFELAPAPGSRDEDSYGRKLRIVSRGGRSLGGMLVAEGLARRWSGRRQPWCG
jgi:endonuclease YncB( thermonuclease family)